MALTTHFWGWDYEAHARNQIEAVRPKDRSRMICIVGADEEDLKPRKLKRSLLYRDPDSPTIFGDKEILHLQMEAEASPIVINPDGYTGLSEFEGTCDTDNGWHIIFKWWCVGHVLYAYRVGGYLGYNSGGDWVDALAIDYDNNRFANWSVSLELEHYPEDWERWEATLRSYLDNPSWSPRPIDEGLPQWYIHRENQDWDFTFPVLPPGDLRDVFKSYFPHDWDENAVLSRLFTDATAKLNVSDNNIANIREALEFVDAIRRGDLEKLWETFVSDFKDVKNQPLRKIGKRTGQTWLGFRYMYKTTQLDANQAVDAFLKGYTSNLKEATIAHPLRSSLNFGDTSFHLKLRVADSQKDLILSLANRIRRFGMLPDAHVIWDSIPFSFVADWFLPIDDALSAFDEYFYASAYEILEALVSYKRSRVIAISGMQVKFTEYSRSFQYTFPDWGWVSDDTGVPVTRHLNHTADTMALIVSSPLIG